MRRHEKLFQADPGICSKRSESMAKPNFKFQKRQKELEKKKKSEEKLQRKLEKNSTEPDVHPDPLQGGEETQE
jgi:hypothetical protein